MKRTSTYFAKGGEVPANWRLIDVDGQVLGRVARSISVALQGKDKPTYTAHTLTGDFVVVINAAKLRVTGNKLLQKTYYRHSGYVGNLKTFKLRDMMETRPERVIQLAVKGMLPRNNLGRQMLTRLKIYAGAEHPHQAQVRTAADNQTQTQTQSEAE
ncbi:MAG: 50S ribosomal protein L13 [SAR202 cluster bacterium Io17-Chloro-G9]|nr:MAG: 50S ribosomal protein L13 [SAR202 cluster bacterium Io17-Chloro-G9]